LKKEGFNEDISGSQNDTAYVINLDKRPDRWSNMLKKFEHAPFILERFPAIENSVGWKGCGMSHITLIQMAKDKSMPNILVMEDDCKPSNDFNRSWSLIKKWLDNNKDRWDIFIGGNSYYGSIFTSNTDKHLDTIKPICIISSNIKLYYTKMLTTGFYYMNHSTYDRFLEWKKDIDKNGAIDIWPNIIQMKIISCTPFIATQDNTFSDIENGHKNYESPFKESEQVIDSIQNNSVCDT